MAVVVGTNAYVSVADADAYFSALSDTTWSAATDAAKQAAILSATQYLDGSFKWVGMLEDTTQALGWPRLYAYDGEGRTLSDIPSKVEDACCELAKIALSGPLVPASQLDRVRREKIGSVEVEYSNDGANGTIAGYQFVIMLLRGIGSFRNGNGSVKVVRA